ncbi:MAG: hypothetical protein M1114_06290 [Candidatus Dependentiae bacterium]|nr:hypothetical protein [Candidatus Dependentiae bacterium]
MKLTYFSLILIGFSSLHAGESLYFSDSDSGEALSALVARLASRTPSPAPSESSGISSTTTQDDFPIAVKPKKTVQFCTKINFRLIKTDKEVRLQEGEKHKEGTENLSMSSLLSLNLAPSRRIKENDLLIAENQIPVIPESLLSNSSSESDSEEDDRVTGNRTTFPIIFKRN